MNKHRCKFSSRSGNRRARRMHPDGLHEAASRAEQLYRQAKKERRPLAHAVLEECMMTFWQMAELSFAQENLDEFKKWAPLVIRTAASVARFQSSKLRPISVNPHHHDETKPAASSVPETLSNEIDHDDQ